MLDVTQLRNGTVFKYEGEPYVVVNYEHKKLGRGNANIKLKVKSLKLKVVKELSFNSGARVEEAEVERRKAQFLYSDAATKESFFMDPESYEQFTISSELVSDLASFLKEGEQVWVILYEGEPIMVEIPPHVKLKVTETEPGIRGDSVSNIYKPAKLETGIVVQVPLFVKEGDSIEIDTRTGEYIGRASS